MGKTTCDFRGRTLRTLAAGGVRVVESAYSSGLRLSEHAHGQPHFCLVMAGRYAERIRRVDLDRRPGDLMYYGPGVPHAEHHQTDGRHLLIELQAGRLDEIGLGRSANGVPIPMHSERATRLARRMAIVCRRPDPVARLSVECLALEMLLELHGVERVSRHRPARHWLYAVRAILHEHFRRPPELSSIARSVGLHPAHLARGFRKLTGHTLGGYARRLRLEYACRRLRECSDDLAAVALDAGYADQSHLSREVKRATGLTPAALRRTCGVMRAFDESGPAIGGAR